jgi:hypothetical protein
MPPGRNRATGGPFLPSGFEDEARTIIKLRYPTSEFEEPTIIERVR